MAGGLAPGVDLWLLDLDDGSSFVDESTLLRDYRASDDPRMPVIYWAHIPIGLFHVERWEELDGGAYDWSEYDPCGRFPPIKVLIGARGRPLLYVRDGNHRLWYWREHGFRVAPAWVLDYTCERRSDA